MATQKPPQMMICIIIFSFRYLAHSENDRNHLEAGWQKTDRTNITGKNNIKSNLVARSRMQSYSHNLFCC